MCFTYSPCRVFALSVLSVPFASSGRELTAVVGVGFCRVRIISCQATPFEKTLYDELFAYRRAVAAKDGVAPFHVMSESVMRSLCVSRPSTTAALAKVEGLPAQVLALRGQGIVDVIKKLCTANGVPCDIVVKPPAVDEVGGETGWLVGCVAQCVAGLVVGKCRRVGGASKVTDILQNALE